MVWFGHLMERALDLFDILTKSSFVSNIAYIFLFFSPPFKVTNVSLRVASSCYFISTSTPVPGTLFLFKGGGMMT